MPEITGSNGEKLFNSIVRFNSKIMGLVLGILLGLTMFIATNWLLIKGGQYDEGGEYVIGPHLQLLSQYFIGYKVTFWGSVIGFIYGFGVGTLFGAAVGKVYNKIVDLRWVRHGL